jgi:hypothetical protein
MLVAHAPPSKRFGPRHSRGGPEVLEFDDPIAYRSETRDDNSPNLAGKNR